jgi:hypothetical protein
VQIIITPTGLSAFTLADDTTAMPIVAASWPAGIGGTIVEKGFLARQKRTVQIEPLFRQAYPFMAPRFNWQNGFSFVVQREFSTVQNCIAFIAFHPDSVPANGEITLSHTSSSGVIHRYLPNAIVDTPECVDHKGVKCRFQYSIMAPNAWQTTA